ncbi:MAG: hypothetical protein US52_C0053G0020 [candidate division WS6 bacterium GW2011_GWA2_37_6]|uniref:Uncharacterized protein n=1 Tax=candidate division WS6 bacterium GW2011_GWA2_37_6 TaxID=1619087 RepID=A0A0G0GX16_9BACT|nr:MAG: hypothetical protein US52_C0053G0020 [candidate division WS6 bacterium GW2011_GWA2_37_6]
MGKRRYASIEGKEVKIKLNNNRIYNCIVTGSDFSIGLTLQEKDTKRYIMCIHGPSDPYVKTIKDYSLKTHGKMMRYVYDTIKAGELIFFNEIQKICNQYIFDFA